MKALKWIGATFFLGAIPLLFGFTGGLDNPLEDPPTAPGVSDMGHVRMFEEAIDANGCCALGNDCVQTSRKTCNNIHGDFDSSKTCKSPCGIREGCCE